MRLSAWCLLVALGLGCNGEEDSPSPDAAPDAMTPDEEVTDEGVADAEGTDDAALPEDCEEDEECPAAFYCAPLEANDAGLSGGCERGCRLEDPSTCEAGQLCSPEHACVRDPSCESDEDCLSEEYCQEGTCAEGCRVFDSVEEERCPFDERDREQRCNPETRACEHVVACCTDRQCDFQRASACENPADQLTCFNPNPCDNRCETDADCEAEDYCEDTFCARGCRIDDPEACPGEVCDEVSRECEPRPCERDGQCLDAEFCEVEAGECALGCRREPDNCGEGEFCTELRRCSAGCNDDLDCEVRNGAGWYCEGNECQPPCREDSECLNGQICDQLRCVFGCRDDEVEENDDELTAEILDFGGDDDYDSAGTALKACPEDPDFFRFDVRVGHDVRVQARFEHADGDLDLRLHPPGDGEPFVASSVDDDELIVVEDARPGAWHAEVYARGLDRNSYRLVINLTEAAICRADEADDEDDESGGATPLEIEGLQGSERVRERTICEGDVDWYAFDLGNGDGLSVRLSMLDVGELDFALFGPGEPAADAVPVFTPNALGGGDNGPRFIEFQAARGNPQVLAGRYYLEITGLDEAQEGAYELELELDRLRPLCMPDAAEPSNEAAPHDVMSHAELVREAIDGVTELLPEQNLDLEGLSLCGGETDVYRFAARQGDDFEASVLRNEPMIAGDLIIEIRDDQGRVVGNPGRNAQLLNTATAANLEAGDYTVAIGPVLDTTESQYTLRLNRSAGPLPCPPDGFEPNALRQTPTEIAPGAHPDLSLCGAAGDVDWFQFRTEGVADVTVGIEFQQAQADLELDVFFEADEEAMNANSGEGHGNQDNETVLLRGAVPGLYTVRVSSLLANNANYALTLTVDARVFACVDDPDEPNDSFAGAIDLDREDVVREDQWLCDRVPPEVDVFSFVVRGGRTRTVASSFLFGDDGDLYIEIYDSDEMFLHSTAEVPRANSKQCIVIEPFVGDRVMYARIVPLSINRVLDDDERLDYTLTLRDGDVCDDIPPETPGVAWPRVPSP